MQCPVGPTPPPPAPPPPRVRGPKAAARRGAATDGPDLLGTKARRQRICACARTLDDRNGGAVKPTPDNNLNLGESPPKAPVPACRASSVISEENVVGNRMCLSSARPSRRLGTWPRNRGPCREAARDNRPIHRSHRATYQGSSQNTHAEPADMAEEAPPPSPSAPPPADAMEVDAAAAGGPPPRLMIAKMVRHRDSRSRVFCLAALLCSLSLSLSARAKPPSAAEGDLSGMVRV